MKTRPSLILLLILVFVAFVATAVVFGQAGTGPRGEKLYDYSQAIVVLPTNLDPGVTGPSCTKSGVFGIYNGTLYVCLNGTWARVSLATVTPTPTATATATSP